MPKGYVIARITVTDPEAYARYTAAAAEAARAFGGRPLVKGGRHVALEGEARARNVVIEFDSFERAEAYYHSAAYVAARALRAGAALADIIAVEGA